ncbi:MAG: hypothetical protein JXR76_11700 [Deltaproteobacteria bacterium]|nr:hypothetical protein [Deltaproteobacteria bacterium]
MFTPELARIVNGILFKQTVYEDGDWPIEAKLDVLRESLNVVEGLVYDPGFRFTVENAYSLRDRDPDVIRTVIGHDDALDVFLEDEKILLKRAGIPEEYATTLLDDLKEMRQEALPGPEQGEAQNVFVALGRLYYHLKEITEDAAEKMESSKWDQTIDAVLAGETGALLIGLNASALAAMIGLSASSSAVSTVFGGALISRVKPLLAKK